MTGTREFYILYHDYRMFTIDLTISDTCSESHRKQAVEALESFAWIG